MMKKLFLFIILCALLCLCACGDPSGNDVSPGGSTVRQILNNAIEQAQADPSSNAQDASSTAEKNDLEQGGLSDQGVDDEGSTLPSGETSQQSTLPQYDAVDVDLSAMNGTVAYSQVYDFLYNPADYEGKVVKMKGQFMVFRGNYAGTSYYPSVIIRDATACCAKGLEFVLSGEPAYPSGYPTVNSEITVIGVFHTYYEGSAKYCHLTDAIIV